MIITEFNIVHFDYPSGDQRLQTIHGRRHFGVYWRGHFDHLADRRSVLSTDQFGHAGGKQNKLLFVSIASELTVFLIKFIILH